MAEPHFVADASARLLAGGRQPLPRRRHADEDLRPPALAHAQAHAHLRACRARVCYKVKARVDVPGLLGWDVKNTQYLRVLQKEGGAKPKAVHEEVVRRPQAAAGVHVPIHLCPLCLSGKQLLRLEQCLCGD